MDAAEIQVRLAGSGPGEMEASFDQLVMVSAAVELRAARLVTESGLWTVPGEQLRLQVDRDGAVLDVVDAEGRLAVPRRLVPGREVRVSARQRLRSDGSPSRTHLTLRLTLYSPEWGGEDDADFVGLVLPDEPNATDYR